MASNRELSQFASKVVVNDTTGTISFGTTVTDLVVSGVSTFSNVVIGGASTSLVVTGDANISGAVTATSFTGDGSGLTGLNASNLTSGLVPSSVLPAVMINDISGNAGTASAWETARTFAIVGDGSGSVSVDGSANVSLNLSVTGGDADTLDSLNSTQFLRSDQSATMSGTLTANFFAGNGSALTALNASNISTGTLSNDRLPATLTKDISGNAATATNAASAGNALTLGNLNATQFLRSDQSDSISGTLTATAFGGNGSALTALNASNISTGTISNDRLPATITKNISGNAATATNANNLDNLNSTQFLRSDQSDTMSGTLTATAFSGNGSNLTSLNATNITSGTISDSILPNSMSSNTTGNADTASRWASSRTITLAGDTTGSVSLNGSADVTLSVTIKDDSHNHTIANIDGLQTALDAKASATNNFVTSNSVTEIITLSQATYDSLVASGSVVSTVLYVVV